MKASQYQIVQLNNSKYALQQKVGFFGFTTRWEFVHKSLISQSIVTFDTVEEAREYVVDPMAVKTVIEVI